jgi:hypothetical protein
MSDTPPDSKLIDKRTWERHLRSGRLDEKTYERYIKGLPDSADKAASVQTVVQNNPDEPAAPNPPNA